MEDYKKKLAHKVKSVKADGNLPVLAKALKKRCK